MPLFEMEMEVTFEPFVPELAVSKGSQLCLFPHPNLASGADPSIHHDKIIILNLREAPPYGKRILGGESNPCSKIMLQILYNSKGP